MEEYEMINELSAQLMETKDIIKEARVIIKQGIKLMTAEQLSQWKGVRAWLEITNK